MLPLPARHPLIFKDKDENLRLQNRAKFDSFMKQALLI